MDKPVIKWAKVYDDAIIPTKRDEDAGYDVYAHLETGCLVVRPHETVVISAGIASAFPIGYVCLLQERGSTGSKGIGQRSGVIDSGYRGEWFIGFTNHNNIPLIIAKEPDKYLDKNDVIVYPYTKAICQAVFLEVPEFKTEEIEYKDLKKITSERGINCKGSTGK